MNINFFSFVIEPSFIYLGDEELNAIIGAAFGIF